MSIHARVAVLVLASCSSSGTTDVPDVPDAGPVLGATITHITLEAPAATDAAVVSVGQVFAPGDVPPGTTVRARVGDTEVPSQVDAKALHADGSLRHAVITLAPTELGPTDLVVELVSARAGPEATPLDVSALGSSFDVEVIATIAGESFRASVKPLLGGADSSRWLSGPLATEWEVAGALVGPNGPHPHLIARVGVRAVPGGRARIDVVVENAWAFAPSPSNFTYDAAIAVAGREVWTHAGLVAYAHSRWRRVVTYGDLPDVSVRHELGYILDSGALPNFDRTLVIPESLIANTDAAYTAGESNPTGVGLAAQNMHTTGGRRDIGLVPGWNLIYLMSGDPRAKRFAVGTADRAGSWSIHYRDQRTGRPVTIDDFPYMTILGNPSDAVNPSTGQSEAFPACATCATTYMHDSSHQPGFSYVPYLLTGDHFHLEELQFWANYNLFQSNPSYRKYAEGLLPDQVRGQAWSLRTLGETAYITPDTDPLKAYFVDKLDNNRTYYETKFVAAGAPSNNVLGVITDRAMVYDMGRGLAPWQDDFFTSAVGHLVELGFLSWRPLLEWKVRFAIGRMTAPGYCWISGAPYSLNIRDSSAAPLYTSFAQAYDASISAGVRATECGSDEMAAALGLMRGEMTGYSSSGEGYPAIMQPALAMAADSGAIGAAAAWAQFAARTVKPDYALRPNFAVLPRGLP